ncbi:MAG: imidazole glycerol phosphate synthase subunit HisH [Candidatus Odinarchaeum yellowstonii]|uniref:Imidazole glycerol phosphate synthase subunit HisH n=1 Tax=Odinarchaeota yellowstonii (strain LCB_4) TaxID=1841599 RepID=A0AAF0IC87_ODILC|nr:MAG: imidazole glycerol phosphate synthase subunit HisH [Candidatus Odinarchaeum yellowstonii]
MAVIDYGLGNLRSIFNALKKLGAEPLITSDCYLIKNADAVILPGVGAFKDAMDNLKSIQNMLVDEILNTKPVLGICLGLQLMLTESREGGLNKGLNIFRGSVIRLPETVKAPHIGWNTITIINSGNHIIDGLKDNSYFYFVHSYYATGLDTKLLIAETEYGVRFPSIIGLKNIFATQFHPEKSGENGLKLLTNFIKYVKG